MTSDGIHVLHVDDDRDLAETTATFLEQEPPVTVHVETAPSDGLAYLRANDVDCIISDHDMPEQDGISFLRRVREAYPDIPFVLYTGKGSEAVASDAISAGVTDYLQKAVGTDHYAVLANRVTNAVSQYRAQREATEVRRQLEAVVEHTADAIVIIDRESTIRFANPAVEDVFGYPPTELEGKPLTALMPERYHEGHRTAFSQYLDTGERTMDWQSVILEARRRDGEEIPVSISFGEFERDGSKRFIGVIRETSGDGADSSVS